MYASLDHGFKDRTLVLATTQNLQKRELSPLSKLKQTRGIATTKRVADNFEVKNALAQREYPGRLSWRPFKEHVFRDTDSNTVLAYKQADFLLMEKPEPLENPGHMSVHNTLPRFWSDRERRIQQKT